MLRRAIDLYKGDFVEDEDYLWIEPAREDLHRRGVDTHLRVAELEMELNDADAASAVLERVIELDRYAEEPYRRLMQLLAQNEQRDAVQRVWKLLQNHLAEIDLDPEIATTALYRDLMTTSEKRS